MDQKGEPQPNPQPPATPDAPRSPVMDVVARRPDSPPGRSEIAPPQDVMAQIAPTEASKPVYKEPIADMVKPSAPVEPTKTDEPDKSKKKAKVKAEAPPKTIKQAKHHSGVGAAIAMTIVVMMVLAGLAVYAYMQSSK
jgi:hypothetical protein